MTIEELEQQIKSLQDEVDKLKSEQTKGGIKPWRANENKIYWYIDFCHNVTKCIEKNDNWDDNRYSFGNYYRTQEIAEQDRKEIATRNKIRQLRDELCKGYEFIPRKSNFYIYFYYCSNCFYVNSCLHNKSIGEIYFDTEEHAQQACDILNRELKTGILKYEVGK